MHDFSGDNDALIIVDVQTDFLPGGALGVTGGDVVIPEILAAAMRRRTPFKTVAFTRDFHPADHISFSDSPEYKDMSWPPHCVQGTPGSEINRTLLQAFPHGEIFSKGMDPKIEQYSGFNAVNEKNERLCDWLAASEVDGVVIVGLAMDYCVAATAVDFASNGWIVSVATDATRGVAYKSTALAVAEMAIEGVLLV